MSGGASSGSQVSWGSQGSQSSQTSQSSQSSQTSQSSQSSHTSGTWSTTSSTSMSQSVEEKSSYNIEVIGKIGITGADIKLDSFGNPLGTQYDLVKDKALHTSVLIYDNHGGIGSLVASVGLKEKGITFFVTSKEAELVQKLTKYDELWIIPCEDKFLPATVAAVQVFVKGGKGVWIFGGNANQLSN